MADKKTGKNTRDPIDWALVRDRVIRMERIPGAGAARSGSGILACLDKCLEEARAFAKPKIVSSRRKIARAGPNSVKIEGGITLSGSYLSSYLKSAKYLVFFLATLGGKIENTVTKRMEEGEQLEGYLLDRIGSMAVESLAEGFEDKLRRACASKDMSVSMRLSPGYCDWPIEEQKKMARILPFTRAGVHLTKNCMMVPLKSISAVAGVGPEKLFSKTKSQCGICQKRDCSYRRAEDIKAGAKRN